MMLIVLWRSSGAQHLQVVFDTLFRVNDSISLDPTDLIEDSHGNIHILTEDFDQTIFWPIGTSLVKLDSINKVSCVNLFKTREIDSIGLNPFPSWKTAYNLFLAENGDLIVPFSTYVGPKSCVLPNSFLTSFKPGILVSRECGEISKAVIYDNDSCTRHRVLGYFRSNANRSIFLLEETIHKSIYVLHTDDLGNIHGKAQISFNHAWLTHDHRSAAYFDQEDNTFIVAVRDLDGMQNQVYKVDLSGDVVWSIPINHSTNLVKSVIRKHKRSYWIMIQFESSSGSSTRIVEVDFSGNLIRDYILDQLVFDFVLHPSGFICTLVEQPLSSSKNEIFIYDMNFQRLDSFSFSSENHFLKRVKVSSNGDLVIIGRRDSISPFGTSLFHEVYFSRWRFEKKDTVIQPPLEDCSDIFFAPNPSGDELTIGTEKGLLPLYIHHVNIFGPKGRLIQEFSISGDVFKLDLSNFSEGIYIVQVYIPGHEPCRTERIVVHRN